MRCLGLREVGQDRKAHAKDLANGLWLLTNARTEVTCYTHLCEAAFPRSSSEGRLLPPPIRLPGSLLSIQNKPGKWGLETAEIKHRQTVGGGR